MIFSAFCLVLVIIYCYLSFLSTVNLMSLIFSVNLVVFLAKVLHLMLFYMKFYLFNNVKLY